MTIKEMRRDFASCKTLAKSISKLRRFGVCHHEYSFYTTLDRVRDMLSSSVPCMWLTRINSELFDDRLESQKYGKKGDQRHTFIKCFSFRQQENAAMWGLYCPPTYKAIRVTVPKKAMQDITNAECYCVECGKIADKCTIRTAYVSDVVYAAVQHIEDADSRSNALYWNETYTSKIKNLEDTKDWKTSAGRVKDAEWRFEDESRLVIKTKEFVGNHIAVALPRSFIDGMRFKLSPWANDDERRLVNECLSQWLEKAGRKDEVVQRSVLEKALVAWAERRGLD